MPDSCLNGRRGFGQQEARSLGPGLTCVRWWRGRILSPRPSGYGPEPVGEPHLTVNPRKPASDQPSSPRLRRTLLVQT